MTNWLTRSSWALWRSRCRKDARAFIAALKKPEAAQAAQLRSVLVAAQGTQWAKTFGINATSSLEAFREQVPVQSPEELTPWIDRMIGGEPQVLTSTPVERLVPTSGTTGPCKLIPMTRASRREYSVAVNLWMNDCFEQIPSIRKGRVYIATSPSIDAAQEQSAVPIGFAEDRAYLGRLERGILNHILAVPKEVARLREEDWRRATRDYLMGAIDLRFLSLWHPGYLEALFEPNELENLSTTRWQSLSLISCWSDGACGPAAERLIERFPQARFQAKGLWLTEGPITIPRNNLCPLALLSAFLEFEAEDGSMVLAHELDHGAAYRPILTNHAGLYRYRLGDLVRVETRMERTPCLRWIGRADQTADICGEKLSEAQIGAALRGVGWEKRFRFKPMRDEHPPFYLCLIDEPIETFPLESFETALRRNPHYHWARQLGQLSSLRIQRVQRSQLEKPAGQKRFHQKDSYLWESELPTA